MLMPLIVMFCTQPTYLKREVVIIMVSLCYSISTNFARTFYNLAITYCITYRPVCLGLLWIPLNPLSVQVVYNLFAIFGLSVLFTLLNPVWQHSPLLIVCSVILQLVLAILCVIFFVTRLALIYVPV